MTLNDEPFYSFYAKNSAPSTLTNIFIFLLDLPHSLNQNYASTVYFFKQRCKLLSFMVSADLHCIFTILKGTLEQLPGSSNSLFLEFLLPSRDYIKPLRCPMLQDQSSRSHLPPWLPRFRGDFASLLSPTFCL